MSIFSKAKTLTLTDNMPFGKHKDMTIKALIVNDRDYIQWLLEKNWTLDTEAYKYFVNSGVDYTEGRGF